MYRAPSPSEKSEKGWEVVCTQANTKMTICPRHRHLLGRFCERQGLVRLDCKPLSWKMRAQGTGRRRKSSLRSCQYPGHTLDHTGKITTVAGGHVVNFQIAREISQSFASSCKYHSFSIYNALQTIIRKLSFTTHGLTFMYSILKVRID